MYKGGFIELDPGLRNFGSRPLGFWICSNYLEVLGLCYLYHRNFREPAH